MRSFLRWWEMNQINIKTKAPLYWPFFVFEKKFRKNVGISFNRTLIGCMNNIFGTRLQCIRSNRIVFEDLSFHIESGDVLHLTGPNGSGKSSLLRILAGVLRPSAGKLSWDGASEPIHEKIQYIGHQNAVKGALSVLENLSFWLQINGDRGDQKALACALQTFGLEKLANLPAQFLSAGQARRLTLARLLVVPAPLWILDEPATSLDTASEGALQSAINGHSEAGGMVVMATHTPVEADAKVLNMSTFGKTRATG